MTTARQFSATFAAGQTASEATLIDVRDVTMCFPIPKRYREWVSAPLRPRRMTTALSNVSVQINRGDRIAVMGPNGAGKTTLLKLIAGVLLPTAGKVFVDGRSTVELSTAARKSVGFVFNEERSFFWRLSGAQNLQFFGALDNLHGRELQQRVEYLMELVGLQEARDKAVAAYSSGMKQRLALARVLITEPDVLILDEPTRALDPLACDEVVELILSTVHRDSGKTVLMATHRAEEASLLCNEVLIVAKGMIQGRECVDELRDQGLSVLEYYRQLMLSGGRA